MLPESAWIMRWALRQGAAVHAAFFLSFIMTPFLSYIRITRYVSLPVISRQRGVKCENLRSAGERHCQYE